MLNYLKRKTRIYCFLALCWVTAYFFLQFLQFQISHSNDEMKLIRFKSVIMGIVLSFIWEEVYQQIRKHSRHFPSFSFFVISFSFVGSIVILVTYLAVESFGGWVYNRDPYSLDIAFYRTKPFLIILVYSYCVMFGINFLREIDRKLGRGNLLKLIIGRYFVPHEEQRIFLFMEKLKIKGENYLREYGHIPYFKAGIHSGRITVAEVGDLKREIAYHGDAINTASRIQGLCNEYRAGCLISEDVLRNLKMVNGFQLIALGKIKLRGRKEPLDIYTVTRKENE